MYCLANRRVRSIILKPARRFPSDPYGPAGAGFAERHQESVTQLGNGLVRIDLGEPVHGKIVRKAAPKPKAAPPPLEVEEPPPLAAPVPAPRQHTEHSHRIATMLNR